jgi:beta-lactamase regulating signal transducer with metallopeptidase domain
MTTYLEDLAPLAWTQFWQVTLVAMIAGGVARFVCRNSPRLAYALWMLIVVKALTPPLWSSPTGVFSWALAVQEMPLPAHAEGFPAPIVVSRTPVATIPGDDPVILVPDDQVSSETVLLWLWGAGLVGCLMMATGKQAVCSFLIRQSNMPVRGDLIAKLDDICRRLGIRRCVRLVVSSRPIGPAAFGLLRPTIVLPEILLAGKTSEQIELILAHELVHIKRGDILAGHLQLAAQVVWWFHPLIWWANREATRERERCCDRDVVEGVGCRPAAYARTLLSVVELKNRLRIPAAIPGVRAMEVTSQRLETIMRFQSGRGKGAWLPRVAFACGAILFMPGAGLTLQADADEKPKAEGAKPSPEPKEVKAPKKVVEKTPSEDDEESTNLKRAEERLRWAEKMHEKKYVSKAQVEAERAKVFELKISWHEAEAMRGRLTLARSDVARAEDRVNWAKKMFEKKYVSKAQLVSEELTLLKAKLKLKQLKQLETISKKPSPPPKKEKPEHIGKVQIIEGDEGRAVGRLINPKVPDIQKADNATKETNVVIPDDQGKVFVYDRATDTLKYQNGVSLKGVARERETGRPIAGASITFQGKKEIAVITDQDGRFKFAGIPEAPEYSLVGLPKDGEPFFITSARVKPTKGEKTINLDLEYARGIPYRVRVIDQGTGKPLLDPATSKPLQGHISYFPIRPTDPYKRGAFGYSQIQDNGAVAGAFHEAYNVDENGVYRGAVLPGPGVLCFSSPAVVKRKVVTDHEPRFFYPDGKDAVRIDLYQNPKSWTIMVPIRGVTNSLGIALNMYTAVIAINPKEDAKEVSYEIKLDQAEASK